MSALFRVERFGDGTVHIREQRSRALLIFSVINRKLQDPICDDTNLSDELLEAARRYVNWIAKNWRLIDD